MTKLNILENIRLKRGLTYRELGELCNIEPSQIFKICKGQMQVTESSIRKICAGLDINIPELFGYSNVISAVGKFKFLPVIGVVEAGNWTEVIETLPEDYKEYVIADVSGHKNTIAIKVAGFSMEPKFLENDVILVDTDLITPTTGKYIVARIDGGEATFKQFYNEGGKPMLMPLNPRFTPPPIPEVSNIEVIGTVWAKTRIIEKV